MYARGERLRTSREWRDVRRRGRCSRGELAIICVAGSASCGRYGFSTTKGFRGAVQRNLARRRLREAFRGVYVPGDPPVVLAATARPAVLTVGFEGLRDRVAEQLRELGLQTRSPATTR